MTNYFEKNKGWITTIVIQFVVLIFAMGVLYAEVKQNKEISQANHELLIQQQVINGQIIEHLKNH